MSPVNLPMIQALWSESGSSDIDVQTCITGFEPRADLRAEEHALGVLSDVDQHHDVYSTDNPYRLLTVIGGGLTPRIRRELMTLGFAEFTVTLTGFVASRNKEAAMKHRD